MFKYHFIGVYCKNYPYKSQYFIKNVIPMQEFLRENISSNLFTITISNTYSEIFFSRFKSKYFRNSITKPSL